MSAILVIFIFSAVNSGICQDVMQRVRPSSILDGINFVEENTYHVSLKHKGEHICSAALLKTQYDKVVAITAASCIKSQKPNEYSLEFGKVRGSEDEYCLLTKIRLYGDFDKQTLNNDLALLFSDDITKTGSCDLLINNTFGVALASSLTPNQHVKVTGWDDTTDTLKIIGDEVCSTADVCNAQVLTEKKLPIASTMLCHGIPNKKTKTPGTCRAERGSPVVVPESPPVLVAVTSWTIDSDNMKDSWYPCVGSGVFDDTIKKWIESEIDEFASR